MAHTQFLDLFRTHDDGSSLEKLVSLVRVAIWFQLLAATLVVAFVLVLPDVPRLRVIVPLGLALAAACAHWLLRRNGQEAAVRTLLIGSWLVVTLAAFGGQGISSTMLATYPLIVVCAGWLLGPRAGIAVYAASTLALLAVVMFQQAQVIDAQPPLPLEIALIAQLLVLGMSLIVSLFLWRNHRARLAQENAARREAMRALAELERTSAALAEKELRWRFAIEGCGDGLWDWNIEDDALFFSENWKTILGYDGNEFEPSAQAWRQRIHPDDLSAAKHATWNFLVGRETKFINAHRVRDKDGGYKWIQVRGSVSHRADSGKPLRMVGTFTDITEHKLRQAKLDAALNFQESVLHLSPYALFATDAAGRITHFNPSAEVMFGYESDELIGREVPAGMRPRAVFIDQDDRRRGEPGQGDAANRLDALLQQARQGMAGRMQWNFQRKDGSRFPGNLSMVALRGERDTVTGYLGVAIDLTDSVREKESLLEAKADAEQANQAKSRFLAAASHDLRQPLSALTLYVGMLKHKVAPVNREIVGNIQECLDTLNELLTDLLDVSKLDAGVVQPVTQNLRLDEMLSAIVAVNAAKAAQKGLQLRLRRCDCVVRTDPRLLQRIVGNLVANAVQYTRHGGVLIACRWRDDKYWVEVWDTGIGIAPENRQAIFEEFNQVGDRPGKVGSGLGLAIVAKSAALLGLQVRMRSRPGRGSMFAIELTPGEEAVGTASARRAAAVPALRIALVDDNLRVRDALHQALSGIGHEVIAAAAVQPLIDRLAKHAPDIVIADYRLGGSENGVNVIEAVRGVFGEQLPAVLITGDTDPTLPGSMAKRHIAIFHKPFRVEALCEFINGMMYGGRT